HNKAAIQTPARSIYSSIGSPTIGNNNLPIVCHSHGNEVAGLTVHLPHRCGVAVPRLLRQSHWLGAIVRRLDATPYYPIPNQYGIPALRPVLAQAEYPNANPIQTIPYSGNRYR